MVGVIIINIIIKDWNFTINSFSGRIISYFFIRRAITAYVGEIQLSQYSFSNLKVNSKTNHWVSSTAYESISLDLAFYLMFAYRIWGHDVLTTPKYGGLQLLLG